MTDFIAKLKENLSGRLHGLALPTEMMSFARDPFGVVTDGGFAVSPSTDEFWTDVNTHQFPNIKKVVVVMLVRKFLKPYAL